MVAILMAKRRPSDDHREKAARLAQALRRLEIPDCGCDFEITFAPNDKDHEQPLFPPPCQHVLAADHDIDPERWRLLLLDYFRAEHAQPPDPDEPTAARPGSKAKIEVMRLRLEKGRHIYHARDAEPRDFVGLGSVWGFVQNGHHPREAVIRLCPGAGVRQKPRRDGQQ